MRARQECGSEQITRSKREAPGAAVPQVPKVSSAASVASTPSSRRRGSSANASSAPKVTTSQRYQPAPASASACVGTNQMATKRLRLRVTGSPPRKASTRGGHSSASSWGTRTSEGETPGRRSEPRACRRGRCARCAPCCRGRGRRRRTGRRRPRRRGRSRRPRVAAAVETGETGEEGRGCSARRLGGGLRGVCGRGRRRGAAGQEDRQHQQPQQHQHHQRRRPGQGRRTRGGRAPHVHCAVRVQQTARLLPASHSASPK